MTNGEIILSERYITIAVLGGKNKKETLNALIILSKWNIYKIKLNHTSIFFSKFMCDLKYYLIIEKTIAINQEKIIAYNSKWLQIENLLT
jgi:hypothetical protein